MAYGRRREWVPFPSKDMNKVFHIDKRWDEVKQRPELRPVYKRSKPRRIKGLMEGIVLDGFKLLAECKSDLPERAKRGTLDSMNISEVVSQDLAYFTNLRYLDLGDNCVQFASLYTLTALQELHLHCNGLERIPPIGKNFKNLRILGLGYNSLTQSALKNMSELRLEELDLSSNNLSKLPVKFGSMQTLVKLSLRDNCFGCSASQRDTMRLLGSLPLLTELDMSENIYTAIPDCIGEFQLDQSNQTVISRFQSLQFLDFQKNQIEHEEEVLTLSSFPPALELVDLRGNPAFFFKKVAPYHYPLLYKTLVLDHEITEVLGESKDTLQEEQNVLRPDKCNAEVSGQQYLDDAGCPLGVDLQYQYPKKEVEPVDATFLTNLLDKVDLDIIEPKSNPKRDRVYKKLEHVLKNGCTVHSGSKITNLHKTNQAMINRKVPTRPFETMWSKQTGIRTKKTAIVKQNLLDSMQRRIQENKYAYNFPAMKQTVMRIQKKYVLEDEEKLKTELAQLKGDATKRQPSPKLANKQLVSPASTKKILIKEINTTSET